MANGANVRVRQHFAELRALNSCCVPGCFGKVQFAHKTQTELNGRGRKERYYDIIRHPFQYLPLCEEHHRAYDKGELQVSGCVIFGWLVPVAPLGWLQVI